jgi:hypothetical protein
MSLTQNISDRQQELLQQEWDRQRREDWYKGRTDFGIANGLKTTSRRFSLEGLACSKFKQVGYPNMFDDVFGIFDHTRWWIENGRPFGITTEPYRLYSEKLSELQETCDALGLELLVNGDSEWNPGQCHWIAITRK